MTTAAVGPAETVRRALEPLRSGNWSDIVAIDRAAGPILRSLASDRPLLRGLLEGVCRDPDLHSKCERDAEFHKLVLFNDPKADVRLRLHVVMSSLEERPHSHRMSFSSLILHGELEHRIYSCFDTGGPLVRPSEMRPVLCRQERTGTHYTMHHSMVHTISASGCAVSLVARGPAEKDRALNTNLGTDESWWHYGGRTEAFDAGRMNEVLSEAEISTLIAFLEEIGIV